MDKLLITFSKFIFPDVCIGCGFIGDFLCSKCIDSYRYIDNNYCLVCSRYSSKGFTHISCITFDAPERLILFANFDGCIKKAIVDSKYNGMTYSLLEGLIDHFCFYNCLDLLEDLFKTESLIVPIPISKHKLKKRSFNQAVVIADHLSKSLKIPVRDLLKRTDSQVSQSSLNRKERYINIKGVFELVNKSIDIKGKSILLVDDVCTTGATFLEAAKVLKDAGVRHVWCFALAHPFYD